MNAVWTRRFPCLAHPAPRSRLRRVCTLELGSSFAMASARRRGALTSIWTTRSCWALSPGTAPVLGGEPSCMLAALVVIAGTDTTRWWDFLEDPRLTSQRLRSKGRWCDRIGVAGCISSVLDVLQRRTEGQIQVDTSVRRTGVEPVQPAAADARGLNLIANVIDSIDGGMEDHGHLRGRRATTSLASRTVATACPRVFATVIGPFHDEPCRRGPGLDWLRRMLWSRLTRWNSGPLDQSQLERRSSCAFR